NYRLTFYVMLPFILAAMPLTVSLREPKRKKLIIKKSYVKNLGKILGYCMKNKILLWLLLFSSVMFALNQSALWFYQPYFSLSGLDVAYFGFAFASFQVVAALSSKYSYKIERRIGRELSFILIVLAVSGAYFLMANFIFIFSFAFAFLHQFARGFMNIIFSDYINQIVESKSRATILSVKNMLSYLSSSIIFPLVGLFADAFSILQTFLLLGFLTLFVGTAFFLIHMNLKSKYLL
ncbi:MAG TPA: MFS transporter, partial [Candidatus Aenigmarchaeota archaeon]|nr:MFS transporter [Candidatus Aenigmarchaeota archaeon]